MEPTGIVWEEPPDDKNPRYLAADVAETLRKRPNAWAKVLGPTSQGKVESLRVMLMQGSYGGVNAREFETRRKKVDKNDELSYCLWARYVGNGSEADR